VQHGAADSAARRTGAAAETRLGICVALRLIQLLEYSILTRSLWYVSNGVPCVETDLLPNDSLCCRVKNDATHAPVAAKTLADRGRVQLRCARGTHTEDKIQWGRRSALAWHGRVGVLRLIKAECRVSSNGAAIHLPDGCGAARSTA
jgi:hypothetical protein